MAQSSRATEQFETGDILDPSTISGSYESCSGSDCWAGTSGGPNPSWNGGTARWSYGMQSLTWTTAINQALQESGLQIDGYQYEWIVKNYNAVSTQTQSSPDHLIITLNIYNTDNEVVHTKKFDYSYSISDWTSFTGVEYLDQSLTTANLSDLSISAYGDDHGYWAGHYGPEFDVSASSINLIYSYAPIDPCDSIPVIDPTCPNYVTPGTIEDTLAIATPTNLIGDNSGEIVADETLPEVTANESITESVSDMADMASQSSSTEEQEKKSTGLSDEQRNALANAAAQASSAVSVASQSSQQSQSVADQANADATGISATGEISTTTILGSVASSSSTTSQSSSQSSSSQSDGSQTLSGQSQESVVIGGSESDQIEISSTVDSQQVFVDESEQLAISQFAFEINVIESVVDRVIKNQLAMMSQSMEEEPQEELVEQNIEDQNAQEDALVDAAQNGDDSEEAQLALMGFNPNFRAYQQPQMPDAIFYKPKEIYEGQENYDNPNQRFFNGASDVLHDRMIDLQYRR